MVPIKCDATSKDDLAAAASKVQKEVGFVNAVIANSGITGPSMAALNKLKEPSIDQIHEALWNVSQEDFTQTFAVNDTAMFFTCLAFLKLLDAGNKDDKSPIKGQGIKSQFIATSSIGGFSRNLLAGFAYSASKAACTHLVKCLSTYLVPHHIRANVIAPGMYASEMNSVSHSLLNDSAVAHRKYQFVDEVEGIKEGAFSQNMIPAARAGAPQVSQLSLTTRSQG